MAEIPSPPAASAGLPSVPPHHPAPPGMEFAIFSLTSAHVGHSRGGRYCKAGGEGKGLSSSPLFLPAAPQEQQSHDNIQLHSDPPPNQTPARPEPSSTHPPPPQPPRDYPLLKHPVWSLLLWLHLDWTCVLYHMDLKIQIIDLSSWSSPLF